MGNVILLFCVKFTILFYEILERKLVSDISNIIPAGIMPRTVKSSMNLYVHTLPAISITKHTTQNKVNRKTKSKRIKIYKILVLILNVV